MFLPFVLYRFGFQFFFGEVNFKRKVHAVTEQAVTEQGEWNKGFPYRRRQGYHTLP